MATTTTNYGFDVPTSSDLVKNGATAISTLGQDIDTFLFRPFTRNAVINGGMDIWQRGTSFIGTGYNYCADRFLCFRAGFAAGMTVSRQTSAQTGFQYAMRIARDSGNTGTGSMSVNYALESAQSYPLAGQTLVFSFYARAGANFSGGTFGVSAVSGTGNDQATTNIGSWTGNASIGSTNATLTTTFQRFSFTCTVGSTATQIGFNMGYTPSGTAGANDWVEITGIQIEVGNQASPFTRAGGTIQGELAACQRYYFRAAAGSNYSSFAVGLNYSTTACQVHLTHPVSMRTASSVDYSTLAVLNAIGTPVAITGITYTGASTLGSFLNITGAAGLVAGDGNILVSNNSTSGYIAINGEL